MPLRAAEQPKLFDLGQQLPNGLIYRPDFIIPEEEETILTYIHNLPLETMIYKDKYESKRRHYEFDFPFPRFLHGVQEKIAKWLQIKPEQVAEALLNEYTTGSAIGWHVDRENYEKIIGLSLTGWCKIRFRPLKNFRERKDPKDVVSVELEPRSAYIMQNDVRWKWQHSVAPVPSLRYSITFRTLPN
ncbi:alpha-ketoglutarate-dependent dioxygenase AlkB [Candidatus Parcubacteria bacterium]|nr:alpha-ketoglutarate-dependent dioxygenase AlkB [Candidatus Parcubacteria bacterium]